VCLTGLGVELIVVVIVGNVYETTAEAIGRKDEKEILHAVVDEFQVVVKGEDLEEKAGLDASDACE